MSAGCAGSDAPDAEDVGSSSDFVISDTATEAVFYKNPGGADGLPELVPVVISKKSNKPDVAFRLDCGSNFMPLLKGFGYSESEPTGTFTKYPSLTVLQTTLNRKRGDGTAVPVIDLRCGESPEDARSQIAQVYRVVGGGESGSAAAVAPASAPNATGTTAAAAAMRAAKAARAALAARSVIGGGGGPGEYYLRLRNDPSRLYAVGCVNILAALGWTDSDGASLENGSIPVTPAVRDAWRERGIEDREINCYTNTGRGLPSTSGGVTRFAYDPGPSAPAQLFTLSPNPFPDDVFSDDVLYLISDGKGYAIDCGSNHRAIKTALGFAPTEAPPRLLPTDALYVGSRPGEQPILRCENEQVVAYDAQNETLPTRYFQFNGAGSLVRFTCPQAEEFFSAGVTEPRRLPKEALPELLANPDDADAKTPVAKVACGPKADWYASESWTTTEGSFWEAQQWFSGDFDGDGKSEVGKVFASANGGIDIDIHVSDGASFRLKRWTTGAGRRAADAKTLAGDFNGDGKTDIAQVFPEDGLISIDVLLSTGVGFQAPVRWATKQGSFWATQHWFAGDFDGDGDDDLAKAFRELEGVSMDVHVSDGRSKTTLERWATNLNGFERNSWVAGDFDGDGRTDMAEIWGGDGSSISIDAYIVKAAASGSTARGTFVLQAWARSAGSPADHQRYLAGDFDGDGKADIASVQDDGGMVSIESHRSTGSRFAVRRLATRVGVWDDGFRWLTGTYDGAGRVSFAKLRPETRWGSVWASLDVIRAR